MQAKALEQLRSGQSLTGKEGVFAPLLKQFMESALEAEMSSHLGDLDRISGNKRNGKKTKTLKTDSGEIVISTPQDRNSSFEPQLVKKRETVLSDNFAPKIIGLYGLGMSFHNISGHIKEMYDVEISQLFSYLGGIAPCIRKFYRFFLELLVKLFSYLIHNCKLVKIVLNLPYCQM